MDIPLSLAFPITNGLHRKIDFWSENHPLMYVYLCMFVLVFNLRQCAEERDLAGLGGWDPNGRLPSPQTRAGRPPAERA